jgi:hypothetical protein
MNEKEKEKKQDFEKIICENIKKLTINIFENIILKL